MIYIVMSQIRGINVEPNFIGVFDDPEKLKSSIYTDIQNNELEIEEHDAKILNNFPNLFSKNNNLIFFKVYNKLCHTDAYERMYLIFASILNQDCSNYINDKFSFYKKITEL